MNIKSAVISFLKAFVVAALMTGLGVFLILLVLKVSGAQLRSDVAPRSFIAAVSSAVAIWFPINFLIVFISIISRVPVMIAVPFQDKQVFLSRLNDAIAKIRYRPKSQSETLLTFKPPRLGLLARDISIEMIEPGSARIVGPRGFVKRLHKKIQS